MKYERLKEYPDDRFRRITGVKRKTFEKMCAILKTAYELKHMLLAALEHLREYRTYASYSCELRNSRKQHIPLYRVG